MATKIGGGSQDVEFEIQLNDVMQPKTKIVFSQLTSAGSSTAYAGGTFTISNGDTIQLFAQVVAGNINDTDVISTVLVLGI